MRKILLITGDAGEALEIYYPKYRLEEEGWQVDLAAPEKRPIQSVVHDFESGFDTYTEKLGYRVQVDAAVADVRPEDYDALVIPGGRAPEYLRNDSAVVTAVSHFVEAGKPIAVTCHGLLILAMAEGLRCRTATCYPQCAPDLRAAGATYVDREVMVDGPVVTSQAWNNNGPWMREFVRILKG